MGISVSPSVGTFGVGGSVASTGISDSTATGRSLVTAADAAVAASVVLPLVAVSLATDTGWSFLGSGSPSAASVGGGSLSITSEGGAGHYARACVAAVDGLSVEHVVRLTTATSTVTGQAIGILLATSTAATSFVGALVRGDEIVYVHDTAGATSGVAVSGILGGQGWVRLVVRGGDVDVYAGVGTGGALPTSWTPCGYATQGTRGLPWTHLCLQGSSDSGTSTWTWTSTDLRYRVLP
jgi:hypothetical protein